ncbi:MAG: hypothetical protein ACTSR3_15355, partial [Candidatus Helarchaeota archaeon]
KPLELHSKLVKNIRKAIRKIVWVENYRKGDLKLDKVRRISQYLERVVEDLFTLTKWKIGRNNFRLDAASYYERIVFYREILSKLNEKIGEYQILLNAQEKRILTGLILKLESILDDNRADYEEINSILISILKIEEILNEHGKEVEIGLEALKKILKVLKKRQKEKKN